MARKNVLGLPWWVWLLGGGAILYFVARPKKAAAMPASVVGLSKTQDDLANSVADALGFPSPSRLIVNIGGAQGPVEIVDRLNNATVVKSTMAPDALLVAISNQGQLDPYWTDPFGALSLHKTGWQSGPIVL